MGEPNPKTILITGAAGNLGGLLARHLLPSGHQLRLMWHETPLPGDLALAPSATPVRADLADPASLAAAVQGVDAIVHFAGVLFAARPERFLPVTNTRWFAHLLRAALEARVSRIILVSFPQVEGPTSVDRPATGRLDGRPDSVHAQTRLEEERLLFRETTGTATTPVVLRLGMVYGRGVLMIDAARWLARHGLLAVWRAPTWIHLISTIDAMRALEAAALRPGVSGTYHVGDERPVTLQHFLDEACRSWGYVRPRRLPFGLIRMAATLCEAFAFAARSRSPLTRDFIRIGRVSYWGDTARTRADLTPELVHETLSSGAATI